jgi:hypothetical protein
MRVPTVSSHPLAAQYTDASTIPGPFFIGTYLSNVNWTDDAILDYLNNTYSPSLVPGADQIINDISDAYNSPDSQSPFNTGNETFGLSVGYKKMSAIRELVNVEFIL